MEATKGRCFFFLSFLLLFRETPVLTPALSLALALSFLAVVVVAFQLRTWQRRQQVAQAHRENPDLAVAEARNQRLQYEQELCGEFLRRRLSGGMAVQSLVFDPEDCNVDDAVATAEACLAPEGGFLDLPRYAIECQWDPCLSSRPSPSPSSSALSSERGDDDANNVYVSREERNATRVASEITRFVRFIRERHDKVGHSPLFFFFFPFFSPSLLCLISLHSAIATMWTCQEHESICFVALDLLLYSLLWTEKKKESMGEAVSVYTLVGFFAHVFLSELALFKNEET